MTVLDRNAPAAVNAFKQRVIHIILGGVKVLRATLYVRGVRTKAVKEVVYQAYVVQNMGSVPGGPTLPPRVYPEDRVYKETTYKSVLPEDQKVLVAKVKALAAKYGFELKVIDVGENHFLDKLDTRLKGIRSFPTLLTDAGLRIEGDITEERIKALLAQ